MPDLHPNHQKVIDELTANPAPLIRWAADSLVMLGAKTEWSMEDNFGTTESLVALTRFYAGIPGAGDQDDEELEFWGRAAEQAGWDTDWEEPDEDDDEEED